MHVGVPCYTTLLKENFAGQIYLLFVFYEMTKRHAHTLNVRTYLCHIVIERIETAGCLPVLYISGMIWRKQAAKGEARY